MPGLVAAEQGERLAGDGDVTQVMGGGRRPGPAQELVADPDGVRASERGAGRWNGAARSSRARCRSPPARDASIPVSWSDGTRPVLRPAEQTQTRAWRSRTCSPLASAADMARWLLAQLSGEQLDGRAVMSPDTMARQHAPHMLVPEDRTFPASTRTPTDSDG